MREMDRRLLCKSFGAFCAAGGGLSLTSAASAGEAPLPVGAPAGGGGEVSEELQVISTGHTWSEGPVWVGGADGYLLFSDVPQNIIHRWDRRTSAPFIQPSGWAGPPAPTVIREGGANGLALGRGGLLIADSGNRCISVIDLATRQRRVIADRYQGKRFNSPNDLVLAPNGDIFLTDPPHGLVGGLDSPLREQTITGVFRITPDNQVHLIADNLSPNGIALAPDGRTVYSTDRTGWVAISLDAQSRPTGQRLLVDRTVLGGGGDGMKTDASGNLWFTGPGGVHVYAPTGERLGMIPVKGSRSNCCFGPGRMIYITTGTGVARGRLKPAFLQKIARGA